MSEQIDPQWVKITNQTNLKCDDLVYNCENINGEKTIIVQYLVCSINDDEITLQKMAINGEPLKTDKRGLQNFSLNLLVENKFSFLCGNINKKYWPKNLKEATFKLAELFNEDELEIIRQLSWNDFLIKYDSLGGLSRYIRNNFGLWIGNFDLLLDCKIDKIDADSSSISILYHFWEFTVYQGKGNKNKEMNTSDATAIFLKIIFKVSTECVRNIISFYSSDTNKTISNEELEKILVEFEYLFIHIIDRYAHMILSESTRNRFIEELGIAVINERLNLKKNSIEKEKQCKMNLLNERNWEYSKYERLFPNQGEGTKDTLFWEFGKKISLKNLNTVNPAVIMKCTIVSADIILKGKIEETLKNITITPN